MTNRIQKIFDKLKAENKKAFVSFSVGGNPDEESSLEIAKAIANSGSHIHEISFPHAEAQADGPIIQLANIESINKGINLKKIIDISKHYELKNCGNISVQTHVLETVYNDIFEKTKEIDISMNTHTQ